VRDDREAWLPRFAWNLRRRAAKPIVEAADEVLLEQARAVARLTLDEVSSIGKLRI